MPSAFTAARYRPRLTFDRRLPVAPQVVGAAESRAEVEETLHDLGFGIQDPRRHERLLKQRLFRGIAAGVVEPQAPVHRQAAEGRTVLRIQRLLWHDELIPPVVETHGQPVRHSVVQPELEEAVLLSRVGAHLIEPLAVEADLEVWAPVT